MSQPSDDNDVAKNIATMGCGTFVVCVLVFSWLFSQFLSQDAAVTAGVIASIVLGGGASFPRASGPLPG